MMLVIEASRGAGAQAYDSNATGCGFNFHWREWSRFLGHWVPSAYPAVCGIQREVEKKITH